MKKILLTLTLSLLLVTTASAATPDSVDLQKKWETVIQAIEQVESSGRANAVSRNGLYVGCLQISEILVRECNRIVGYDKFTYADRLSRDKSHEMFIVYQEHFNHEGNMEKAIRLWNSGDINCMNRKHRTEAYYQRVMVKMQQMNDEG